MPKEDACYFRSHQFSQINRILPAENTKYVNMGLFIEENRQLFTIHSEKKNIFYNDNCIDDNYYINISSICRIYVQL